MNGNPSVMNGRYIAFLGMWNGEALQSLQVAAPGRMNNISMIDGMYVTSRHSLTSVCVRRDCIFVTVAVLAKQSKLGAGCILDGDAHTKRHCPFPYRLPLSIHWAVADQASQVFNVQHCRAIGGHQTLVAIYLLERPWGGELSCLAMGTTYVSGG